MEHDAHLFILQIHASSFGDSQQGKMTMLFSVQHWHQETFQGIGVQDVT
jgi:hypothetical protein